MEPLIKDVVSITLDLERGILQKSKLGDLAGIGQINQHGHAITSTWVEHRF
jgi:hypothetical protein